MAGSDAQLAIASREVAFLRRLFLLQHELSSVELGWHLSERDLGTLEAAVQRAKNEAGLTSEERTDFAYLQTALRYGRVEVYQTTRSRSILRIRLGRPQGLLWKRLGEDSVQWLALERALQAYLSERFEVQIAPGVFLANLARSHWPCGITLENGAIAFTIDRPGVRMGDLENASVVFWAGDAKERGLPAMIRLTSRDSRVSFDRAFHLSWRRVVLQSVVDADEHLNEYANFTAGPYRLPTVMVSTLTEVEAIGH